MHRTVGNARRNRFPSVIYLHSRFVVVVAVCFVLFLLGEGGGGI